MCHEVFTGGSVSYAFTTIPTYPRWGGTLTLTPAPAAARQAAPHQPWLRCGAAVTRPRPRVGHTRLPSCLRQL
jgi:hypothetical protein